MATTKKTTEDIAKPGKTIAHATSRPIITPQAMVSVDPMVAPEKKQQPPSVVRKTIAPITPASNDHETVESKTTESAKVDGEVFTSAAAPIIEADLAANAESKAELAAKKRTELIEKLVAEKKYFVPIGVTARRRHNRDVMLLLAVIAIAAGMMLAADAGLLTLPFALPFDLIKN